LILKRYYSEVRIGQEKAQNYVEVERMKEIFCENE
jgi:hypothetical protein